MALTFRQLRYFLVLSEELHFGRAARRLHISQPPLSASLQQIEDALGARLLERTSTYVRLTPAGSAFQQQARQLLQQLEDTREIVRRVSESPSGLLRIGFTPTMIFRGLPDVLSDVQRQHPGITLRLLEQNSASQVEGLAADRIDVGFIHAIPLPETVASLTIADEAFVCCVPIHHPLARRARVHLRDLVGEPLVLFNRALAPHYYDRIVAQFRVAEVEPTIRHEVSHWLTIVALIAHGMGVALVPRALTHSDFGAVAFLPLADDGLRHESRCIWASERAGTARDLFIERVRARFESG